MKCDNIPLIPRTLLMGNPDIANVRLSPDGKYISFLAPLNGVLNIHVSPLDDFHDSRPVTSEGGQGIRLYYWTYRSGILVYRKDNDGDEGFHIYSVDMNTGETTDLTPLESINGQFLHMSHRIPDRILLGINSRNPAWHDVYSVSLETGEMEMLLENNGFMSFHFDLDMNPVAGIRPLDDGSLECMLRKDGEWERLFITDPEDVSNTYITGIDSQGRILLMSSMQRNTSALVSYDPRTGKWEILAEHEKADLYPWTVDHPETLAPQAAIFDHVRREYKILDEDIRADIEYLKTVCRGDFRIASRTLDDSIWLVEYNRDAGSQKYYLHRRISKKASELCTMRPELENVPLSRMHSRILRSRDGLDLVCYFTLPSWLDSEEGKAPEEPLPTVLVVHGGPWSRDRWRFNPKHQWLANRGYFVLSVNFRSSTGFGKEFLNAGNGEWAGAMQRDLSDAVEWAIENGYSQRNKVAIFGASYGGFAALAGLTFTPEMFACGVDVFGPSNLVTLLSNLPPFWADSKSRLRQQIGALPDTAEGIRFLMERSPISRVDQIRSPLLIGQGANDARVTRVESDQIVEGMKVKGLPVTYLLYPDEGHGFMRPENRLSFNAVAEEFLAMHLGGRYQPAGEDIEGSSMRVMESGGLSCISSLSQ